MEPLARLGGAAIDVLTVLLDATAPCWGLQLIKATGRPSGTVYPLLDRLERAGWVTSAWDDDQSRPGPRRRMYRLTPDGAVAARDALARTVRRRAARRPVNPAPGVAG